MRSIYPTAAVLRHHFMIVSSLRAQGFDIREADAKPSAEDMFLIVEGETPPLAARTIVLDHGEGAVVPFGDGNPARITYPEDQAATAAGLASAMANLPGAPVAADPESLALLALAERVAGADITVLINGPTGTGKEVLARAIHNGSTRSEGPFIAVNCAALPEAMLEALLFGHKKGAFTGASSGGEGFFRAANGGTLLLDEVAEMPLQLQAKLLRALQEREVVPLGATEAEPIDVRVVACANRDLQTEVSEGRFRADLYYRLSVFPLTTKALAERPGDIAALAAAMVVRHGKGRTQLPWITPEVVALLQLHDWPGNVRELENVIQRAMLLAKPDAIEVGDIIFDRKAPEPVTRPEKLSNIVQLSEFQAIRETLAECGGNRVETAKRLGISERTLRYRLAKAREQGDEIAPAHSRAISA